MIEIFRFYLIKALGGNDVFTKYPLQLTPSGSNVYSNKIEKSPRPRRWSYVYFQQVGNAKHLFVRIYDDAENVRPPTGS